MNIKGVLIPFDGELVLENLQKLAEKITDAVGYSADIVSMDDETYSKITKDANCEDRELEENNKKGIGKSKLAIEIGKVSKGVEKA